LEVPKPRDLFTAENLKKFEKPWEEKVPTAFFRGTATGIHSVLHKDNQEKVDLTYSHML
jgi:hypothetical protein